MMHMILPKANNNRYGNLSVLNIVVNKREWLVFCRNTRLLVLADLVVSRVVRLFIKFRVRVEQR